MANNVELGVVVKAIDRATGPAKQIANKLAALNAPSRDFAKSLSKIADESGFGKVSAALGGVGSAARGVMGEAGALGLRLAGIATAAGFAFYTVVHGAVEAGDKLSEMAQRTGLSTDEFASLAYAARQADVEQEAFNSAMDKFNKNLGEAKAGGGALLEFLNKVAPKLGAQVKGAKSTEEALSLMTDAFTRVTDPGKRAALAAAAFGKSGLQMGQFLGQGSAAVQEYRVEFMRLNGSTTVWAQLASNLDNVLKRNEAAFAGATQALATGFFPAVTKVANAVTDFLVKNRDGLARWAERVGGAISAWVDSGALGRLVENLAWFGSTVMRVVEWLGPMGTAIAGVTVLALPLITSVGGLAFAAASLGVQLGLAMPGIWAFAVAIAPIAAPVIAVTVAVAALSAAAYELYTHWSDLVQIFHDFSAAQDRLSFGQKMIPGLGLWNTFTEMNGGGVSGEDGALTPEARARVARLSSQSMSNARPAVSSTTNNASITVEFANAPAGTRVRSDPASTADVSLSMGMAMGTP